MTTSETHERSRPRLNARAEPDDTELELDFGDLEGTSGLDDRGARGGIPSEPLLHALPLRRIIPQDVHSVMDYLDAALVAGGALMTNCPKARAASLTLGGTGLVASALTDYRLSLAKVIPIEAHEVIDYGFGVSAMTAPFVFGYYKTAPLVAAMHVVTGLGTILASVITDYRAHKGIGRARAASQK